LPALILVYVFTSNPWGTLQQRKRDADISELVSVHFVVDVAVAVAVVAVVVVVVVVDIVVGDAN